MHAITSSMPNSPKLVEQGIPKEPSRTFRQHVWNYVSRSPLHSLWDLEGVPAKVIAKNTWNAILDDNLLGRSAELGFYFLFALFPTLFTACSVLGLAARSAFIFIYIFFSISPSWLRRPRWGWSSRPSIKRQRPQAAAS